MEFPLNRSKELKINEETLALENETAEILGCSDDTVDIISEEGFVLVDKVHDICNAERYARFTQNPEICEVLTKRWLSEAWLLPSDISESFQIERFNPQYVPFYVFTVTCRVQYTFEKGNENSSGEISWEKESDDRTSEFNELVTCGSQSINRKLAMDLLNKKGFSESKSILPQNLLPFSNDKSQKFQSQKAPLDIDEKKAFDLIGGSEYVENLVESEIRSKMTSVQQYRNLFIQISDISRKHQIVLLPIYLGGFRYRDQFYEVYISGNKGFVFGNRPYGLGEVEKIFKKPVSTVLSFADNNF